MSNNNPYVTVQGPNYGAGLMNWQGMNQIGSPPSGQQPQQGAASGGAPPGQGPSGAPGQPGTTQQQQMQGLGQRLMVMFGLGGQSGSTPSTDNPTSLAPPTPAPQPNVPTNPASPYGLF